MKKPLSFLLALLLIFSAVYINAFAAAEEYTNSPKTEIENSTVTLNTINNTVSGIKITWLKNDYAKKYRVYRKAGSEKSWSRIYDTTSSDTVSFTDKSVKSGTKYKYTVKALSGSYKSLFDKSGKSITFLTAPKQTSKIVSSGVKISWQKITGAVKYYVYRKLSADSSWTKLGSTSSTDFTDKTLKAGKEYYYTVKAYSGDKSLSSNYGKSCKAVILKTPDIAVSNVAGGIKTTWKKVSGANEYRLYTRKSSENSWTVIKKYSAENCKFSYTDKTAKNGTRYYYTVKAFGKSTNSGWSTKTNIVKIDKAVIKKVTGSDTGVTLSWGTLKGADNYHIYRSLDGGKTYEYTATVKSTSYTDTSFKLGKHTVLYKVRGRNTSGSAKSYGVFSVPYSIKVNIKRKPATFENPLTITIDKNNPYLTVINANYRIPDDYNPSLTYVCNSGERLESTVAKAYEKMYNAAAKDGVYLTPCSGYRSYDLQKRNYNNETAYFENLGYSHKEALKKAAESIMPPGASEHNLGYAMDILCVENWFEDSPQFAWLMKHADDYGFILRYPKDKTKITKVIYEPWHWRYVGTEYAKKIKASGKCMEEYFGIY